MADEVVALIAQYGLLVLGLFALYIAGKWWRRRSLLTALRMARITVQELHRAMTDGKAPLIVDVRSKTSRRLDGRILPVSCSPTSIPSTRRCMTCRSTRSW